MKDPGANSDVVSVALRSAREVALLAAVLSLVQGCFLWTSRSEGAALAKQNQALRERVEALELEIQHERQRLEADLAEADAKVQELETLLEQAAEVVQRNSADVVVEVGELRQQLQTIEGELAELRQKTESSQTEFEQQREELERKIRTMARRAGVDLPAEASEIPEDREAHFAAAMQAHERNEHSLARALFREYVRRYPKDDRADNAQYLIGASYLREQRPATALGELRKVLAEYANGDVADDALYDMGEAFFELRACSDAKAALEALVRTHRRSPLARKAREKLRTIQRAPKDHCTS